ncbi:MAG: hypothetical protein DRN00_00090 [Thermoplasmata archaeon]|nr:MAG: hypothetical protein DRN00_00090 [Thermoplasmata archaeon]
MKKIALVLMTILSILLTGCINGKIELNGKWEQLRGMDGGDMHFICSTSKGILFLSHGFGGVWRSDDCGNSWKMIDQDEFVDVMFYDVKEFDDKLFAGSNKGLWYSTDGERWIRLPTGIDDIDSGKYHIVSLAPYGKKLFFTAVLDKKYREKEAGKGILLYLEDGKVHKMNCPENREITVHAKYPYLLLSSPYTGLYLYEGEKWRHILSNRTTRVFIDDDGNLYAGTIGEWWFIGLKKRDGWEWKQVKLKGDSNKIFYFVVPDPSNKNRLWLGYGGVSLFYSFSSRGSGGALLTGCWDGEKLTHVKKFPNYASSIAFCGSETVDTICGKATKCALITVGGQAVQKTEDGGNSWKNSYEGVYGDTINAINPIRSGILKGCIGITAVSGTEIAMDHGDKWMEGVDFRIGRIDGKLPGYVWCAVSPDKPVKGRYDLIVSTGYPSPEKGDGVFGIDLSNLKSGNGNWIEKLIEGPHYEMVIMGDKLFAGSMERGIDVLDLKTFERSKIEVGSSSIPLVRIFDGKLYFETYDDTYFSDGWRWIGKRGKVYVYENGSKIVYNGYVINFFVKNGEFVALDQESLIYKPDVYSSNVIKVKLPSKKYTDMCIDWENGLIFISTDGEGVFFTTLNELKSRKVELREINQGLLTMRIRNLAYYDNYLFAGTRGYSVWRFGITN